MSPGVALFLDLHAFVVCSMKLNHELVQFHTASKEYRENLGTKLDQKPAK